MEEKSTTAYVGVNLRQLELPFFARAILEISRHQKSAPGTGGATDYCSIFGRFYRLAHFADHDHDQLNMC
jgi:hypothetical protein